MNRRARPLSYAWLCVLVLSWGVCPCALGYGPDRAERRASRSAQASSAEHRDDCCCGACRSARVAGPVREHASKRAPRRPCHGPCCAQSLRDLPPPPRCAYVPSPPAAALQTPSSARADVPAAPSLAHRVGQPPPWHDARATACPVGVVLILS